MLDHLNAVSRFREAHKLIRKIPNNPTMIFKHSQCVQTKKHRVRAERLDGEHALLRYLHLEERRPVRTGNDLESETDAQHGNGYGTYEGQFGGKQFFIPHDGKYVPTRKHEEIETAYGWRDRRPRNHVDRIRSEESPELREVSSAIIHEEYSHGNDRAIVERSPWAFAPCFARAGYP